MPDPRPPSKIKPIPAPIFAITWHTSPDLLPKHIYACSGGGGSAKTGVSNFIEVAITSPSAGEQTIKINTGDDVGVALDAFSFMSSKKEEKKVVSVFLAVGIQNSVQVYRLLIQDDDENDSDNSSSYESVKMVGSLDFGKDYLTNTVAFDPMGSKIAVGGEIGTVCICSIDWDERSETVTIQKDVEFAGHHIKGICKVTYHPTNPNIFLSSAKDGTCRVWDLTKPTEDQCLDTLQCKIFDPKDAAAGKKIPNKILNPAPGQCLVKGCVFADLQGHFIFTIQSGRRGNSFLSLWRITRIPLQEQSDNDEKQPPKFKIGFQEQNRIHIADFPISAVSLSGDCNTLALGDTNGSVMLINTETFKKVKVWECIHDLPVTCLASRPLPIPLAGEDKTGISIDVICSSADSKMCFLTRQRKSTLKSARKGSDGGEGLLSFYIALISMLVWMVMAIKISYDICGEEFSTDCFIHTVWWAAKDRPGISSVPI